MSTHKKIQAIKGMKDILPETNNAIEQSDFWMAFEQVIREWSQSFGYRNIRTPVLENTGLFVRSIGDATDIVEKEMYTFIDSLNGDSLSLRPEGTASCVRAALEHNLLYNNPQRLWYIGPMFRHENTQKGRYRQFHQVGAEALGFKGPDVDAELIAMSYDLWCRLGLADCVSLQVNTLGQKEERQAHRAALITYLEQHQDILDEDAKRRLYTNPLRVLDTKNPALQEMAENAPKLRDYLQEDSLAHYQTFLSMLDGLGIPYVENHRLVRGLDYYNLSVFEWVTTDLGAQGTICAGGRYDGLIEELGGKPTPAAGFAMGIERILLLLEQKGGLTDYIIPPDIYVIQQGEGASLYALQTAQQLRATGFNVIQHAGTTSFKTQLRKADESGARFAVILGENEVKSQLITIKDLRQDHPQQTLNINDSINQFNIWK